MRPTVFWNLVVQATRLVGVRTTLVLLAIAVLLSMFDLVGIAAVYPFVQFIYLDDKSRFLPEMVPEFLQASPLRLNLVALSMFFGLFAAKTLSQYLLIKLQSTRLARASANMTERYLMAMLGARFAVFQKRPASELAQICYSYPGHAGNVILSLSQLVTEAFFVAAVAIVALISDWRITLVSAALLTGVVLLLLIFALRPIQRLGQSLRVLENRRYRLLFEVATSVREIGVMGLAAVFKKTSEEISREVASATSRSNVLAVVPRLSIELVFVFCLLTLMVVLLSMGYPADKALPLMGIVLVGAVRMVPAVSRTLGALSNAKFSAGFVHELVETRKFLELNQRPLKNDHLQFQHKIAIENLSFRYSERLVLDDVSLAIPKGAYVSIVGRSGEGKSTLLDVIIGLQPALAGAFACDGDQFDPYSSKSFRDMIGYVPQSVSLFDHSLAFNISFQDTPNPDRLDAVLAAANLKEFAMGLPNGVRTSLGENGIRVSGGQRQRIGIARALYRNPQILVLDEATSSLDGVTEASLTEEIQKLRGKLTILLVAHRLSTVRMSDCIYVLSEGRIAEKGTHDQLLARDGLYSSLVATTLFKEDVEAVQA